MIPVLLDGRIRDRLEERRDIYKDQQQKGLAQQYGRTLQHLSVVASIIMAKDKFQIQVIVILKSKFWSRILFWNMCVISTDILLQYVPSS